MLGHVQLGQRRDWPLGPSKAQPSQLSCQMHRLFSVPGDGQLDMLHAIFHPGVRRLWLWLGLGPGLVLIGSGFRWRTENSARLGPPLSCILISQVERK